jgi:hypothetical protein
VPSDDVTIRIRLRDALRFKHDADRSARAIDNIGDQASQAARKIARLNAASSKTRVNFGPFSTSMRGGALAVGAMALGIQRLTPALLGAAEATATMAGGAGAAGGVGLLALAQAGGVATLGIKGLTDALGGNQKALKGLDPSMRSFFDTLHTKQQRLQKTASSSMLPGLAAGAQSASKNFGVLNSLVGSTGRTLGGLGADAGGLLGSAGFGRDLRTVGNANVRIIDNLGHAGLNLADGFRHVAVEAAPLAEWLSRDALEGSKLIDVWLANARASGKLSRFFREARTELSLLGSAGGHLGRGVLNLFGAHDVDGTRTLRSLDQVTARFERWTRLTSTQRNVGDAIVAEIPKAVGALMTAVANNLPAAGALGARTFINGFMHADAWGKLLAGGFLAKKLGVFKLGKGILSGGGAGGAVGKAFASRGATPANPMFVAVVNDLPGGGGRGPGVVGKAKRLLPGLAVDALPAAATVAGVAGLIKLGQLQHGPRTPMADRNAAAAGLRSIDPQRFRVRTDAQGFPIGTAEHLPPVRVDNRLSIDGEVVAKSTSRANGRRNARRR